MPKPLLLPLLALLFSLPLQAQNVTITGVVTAADDHLPLPAATVVVKGTTIGTNADLDGRYTLQVPPGSDSLQFTYVGFISQVVAIQQRKVINISLQRSEDKSREVVITALGIKREKKALGYAVQEIKGMQIQTARDASFVNQLQGTVAGLNITSTTGGPGSSSRIVLRGVTSLSGSNQALFVIDGVPVENTTSNSTTQWGGRDYGNGISDINPDDIESVSVLKGPNAAALYGSMAANGVIVITTKKGSASKGIGISFNSSTTVELPYIHIKFQDVYGAGRNGKFEGPWELKDGVYTYNTASASAFGSWGPKMEGQTIRDWDGQLRSFNPQPDNYRDYFQTGITAVNNISLQGGNEKVTYRLSAGNFTTKDIVPNTNLHRTNVTARTTANISDKLSIDVSATYSNQQAENRLGLANSFSAPRNYIMMPRHISAESLENHIMDESGKETTWYTNWNWMTNPYWDRQYELNADTRDRVIGIASATYQIDHHLRAMVRSNADFNFQRNDDREAYNGLSNSLGSYSNGWSTGKQYQSDFLITYDHKISEDISYVANIGGSTLQKRFESTSEHTDGGLAIPYFYSIENSVNRPTVNYHLSESRTNGLYALGQFAYKTWLFADITARNDWSSTLPKSSRSFFYPSLSTGFVFTEALKMNERTLSFGKLRASWAKVGRDTDPYRTSYSYPSAGSFNGSPMYQLDPSIPLLNLKPEITTNIELGTELIFFNGRIGFDFTWYHSNTRNQILPASVSATSGYATAIINSGEIANHGIEIQLRTVPVEKKNFRWNLDFNFAHNKNKVISLTEGLEAYQLFYQWNLTVEARPGHAYGDIVGYGIKRDANGNKLVDENGMYIRDDKPRVLGNYNPKFTGGVRNSFNYKNLALSFLIDYRVGGDMFSGTNMYASGYSGNLESTLEGRDEWYASEAARIEAGVAPEDWVATGGYLAEGVTADGKPNTVYVNPELYWGQFSEWTNEIHEQFIYDASFVKLRELTISYNVPEKIRSRMHLKGLSVALTGRNLWLIYSGAPNIDPESSYTNGNGQGYEIYSWPTRRSIGINIKITL
ncbi:MAG: SusC/RagA family TonB-linked outer membrane protein [Bacteroidia bacterium]